MSEKSNSSCIMLPCSCSRSFALKMQHLGSALSILLLRTCVLSLGFAVLMAAFDGLYTYGVSPPAFPFTAFGTYHPSMVVAMPRTFVDVLIPGFDALFDKLINMAFPGLYAAFDKFLFYYNCAFPRASRLGCGIGLIGAAFWTMHTTPPSCRVQRLAIGIAAGAIAGFRMSLMLSSSARTVLLSTVVFSIGFGIYLFRAGRKPTLPSIPLVSQNS